MMLRWHAIQVALVAKLPKRATSKGVSACTKRLEALRKNAPHIYSRADQPEVKEFKIAQYLLYDEAYTPADVEQAILDAPGMTSIAPALRQAYAAKIVNDAAMAPATQCFIQLREQAQDGLEAYRQEIGKDWTIPWRRSVAYRYCAIQMGASLPRHMRSTLQEFVPSIVHCLLLGWQDWALELLQRSHDRLTDGFAVLSKKKTEVDRRTQLFVLRLLDQWFDKKREAYPPQAYDEPIFEAVLAHWRHPDPAALAPLLLAACDRRTHAAIGKGYSPDLDRDAYWYDPYEVLLVLHLRRELGLSNPVLDHLVMNTPLATLPAPAARFEETLLDGILARFNAQFTAPPAPEVFDQFTFV
ncbi:hypothetical protein [Massilia sp. S19_KUP03_FR1]|uniref:hypothetical protein n=1 Tax=Massilia sp. S19_KUP03_FR1 TaxID=3025503 RepID=UPI002FCDBCA1